MPATTTKSVTGGNFAGAKFHFTDTQSKKPTRPADPYTYQSGFGNQHASEAVPGTLPHGQNSPQNVRFGLYAEQITGTAFIAPRHQNQRAWLYRVRPAVAHQGYKSLPDNPDIESCFLPLNPRVHVSPTQLAWLPFDIPAGNDVDFVAGLKTVAGSGDPTLREGIATHTYVANKDMTDSAFVNSDGDFLIVPQQGTLDITTEFGKLWVEPGEIVVIPRGLRFSVRLVDGPSRGYILEIWGSHYELPELGPLGANGLANARDFLYPTAAYSLDTSKVWRVVYKLGGKFFYSTQGHSPFDVVAWTGNYAPYKYDLTKFVNVGSISVDHIDPSIFTVLTAKSRDPAAPLCDVIIFSPRWDTASNTYRPPYYHRNVASELMGLIYGEYGGRSDAFQPGGLSYECGCVPHGVAYPEFKAASSMELQPKRISEGAIAFMFESSRPFTIAEYAFTSKKLHEHDPKMWDDLVDNFSTHLKEITALTEGLSVHNGKH
jgi:homogentisate 1,2-dioxygenase